MSSPKSDGGGGGETSASAPSASASASAAAALAKSLVTSVLREQAEQSEDNPNHCLTLPPSQSALAPFPPSCPVLVCGSSRSGDGDGDRNGDGAVAPMPYLATVRSVYIDLSAGATRENRYRVVSTTMAAAATTTTTTKRKCFSSACESELRYAPGCAVSISSPPPADGCNDRGDDRDGATRKKAAAPAAAPGGALDAVVRSCCDVPNQDTVYYLVEYLPTNGAAANNENSKGNVVRAERRARTVPACAVRYRPPTTPSSCPTAAADGGPSSAPTAAVAAAPELAASADAAEAPNGRAGREEERQQRRRGDGGDGGGGNDDDGASSSAAPHAVSDDEEGTTEKRPHRHRPRHVTERGEGGPPPKDAAAPPEEEDGSTTTTMSSSAVTTISRSPVARSAGSTGGERRQQKRPHRSMSSSTAAPTAATTKEEEMAVAAAANKEEVVRRMDIPETLDVDKVKDVLIGPNRSVLQKLQSKFTVGIFLLGLDDGTTGIDILDGDDSPRRTSVNNGKSSNSNNNPLELLGKLGHLSPRRGERCVMIRGTERKVYEAARVIIHLLVDRCGRDGLGENDRVAMRKELRVVRQVRRKVVGAPPKASSLAGVGGTTMPVPSPPGGPEANVGEAMTETAEPVDAEPADARELAPPPAKRNRNATANSAEAVDALAEAETTPPAAAGCWSPAISETDDGPAAAAWSSTGHEQRHGGATPPPPPPSFQRSKNEEGAAPYSAPAASGDDGRESGRHSPYGSGRDTRYEIRGRSRSPPRQRYRAGDCEQHHQHVASSCETSVPRGPPHRGGYRPPAPALPVGPDMWKATVWAPVDDYPTFNFFGSVVGPHGRIQRDLEDRFHVRIALWGKGVTSHVGRRNVDHHPNSPAGNPDDPLHAIVTGRHGRSVDEAARHISGIWRITDKKDSAHDRRQLEQSHKLEGNYEDRERHSDDPLQLIMTPYHDGSEWITKVRSPLDENTLFDTIVGRGGERMRWLVRKFQDCYIVIRGDGIRGADGRSRPDEGDDPLHVCIKGRDRASIEAAAKYVAHMLHDTLVRVRGYCSPLPAAPSGADKWTTTVWPPVAIFPFYNFFGRIVGPGGDTQREIENKFGVKLALRGKGSSSRAGNDNDPLHAIITGRSSRAVDDAAQYIAKMIIPTDDRDNEHKRRQLEQLHKLRGDYCEDRRRI